MYMQFTAQPDVIVMMRLHMQIKMANTDIINLMSNVDIARSYYVNHTVGLFTSFSFKLRLTVFSQIVM